MPTHTNRSDGLSFNPADGDQDAARGHRDGAHPYIPNSAPAAREAMLSTLGVASDEELLAGIPVALRAPRNLRFPPTLDAEQDLERYFGRSLARNDLPPPNRCFLGGGVWPHFVPAVCDEIASRREFLTAMPGMSPQTTPGAYQALFEYQSMLCALVDMDATATPTYDWGTAAATCVRTAATLTGRRRVILAGNAGPERRTQITTILGGRHSIDTVPFDDASGHVTAQSLIDAAADDAAVVYVEQPTFFGGLATDLPALARGLHERGTLLAVGADPSSLGVIEPPGAYGADLVCGDLQPLGHHMRAGGGCAGFVAFAGEERFFDALGMLTITALPGGEDGLTPAYFFGGMERSSYATRGEAEEVIGSSQVLAGVVAGVYLALLGPAGMGELGETIIDRRAYAIDTLTKIPQLRCDRFAGPGFKEFVVDFSHSRRTVSEVNDHLRSRGILGGHDLGEAFPSLQGCALYAITEVHARDDIDRLAHELQEALA